MITQINGIPFIPDDDATSQQLIGNLMGSNNKNFLQQVITTNNNFRSPFEDSPFGAYWENNNPANVANFLQNKKTGTLEKVFNINNYSPQIYAPSIDWVNNEQYKDWYKNRLNVLNNSVTGIVYTKPKIYVKSANNPIDSGLTENKIEKISELFLGDALLLIKLESNDIEALATMFLRFLFANNSKAIATYKDDVVQMITVYYTTYKLTEDKPSFLEKLLRMLATLLKNILNLVRKFIHFLLSKLANLIEEFKITDPKNWLPNHKNKEGKNDYYNFFFNSLEELINVGPLLKKLKEPFNNVDNKILAFLGENHTDIKAESNIIDDNRNFIIKAISHYYNNIKKVFSAIYNGLINFFDGAKEALQEINAFMVGAYNGLIGFVHGMVNGVAMLFEEGGLAKIMDAIKAVIKQIKEDGFITFIANAINKIIIHFKKEYSNLDNKYDILKQLGQHLVETVLNVIGIVQGGIALFKKLKDFLTYFVKIINDTPKALDDLAALLKNGVDKIDDFGKKIAELPKTVVSKVQKYKQLAAKKREAYRQAAKDKYKPSGGKGPKGIGAILGKYSKRFFNPEKAGGPIKNLKWQNIKISKKGIEIVKKHLSRFEVDDWNVKMMNRLERIENGELAITDWDKRFYTHEIREFERYKALGHEKTNFNELTSKEFNELWNNTHSATLEDYKLFEKIEYNGKELRCLYHPEIQN